METSEIEKERQRILKPFYSWEAQIRFCGQMEGWDKERSDQAIASLEFLRDFLGEDFPLQALLTDHPIGEYYINNVPWTKEWFKWLAESFQGLKGGRNFEMVESDFRSFRTEEFKDAITLLEYGLKFKKAGYKIDFEQPVLNGRGELKKPDLKITDIYSGEVFNCEISRLTIDALTLLYESTIERIIHGGIRQQKWLRFSGCLHQRLAKEEFIKILPQIDQMVQSVAEGGNLQEMVREGIIELAIAEYHDPSLTNWAAMRGYDVNAWGMPRIDTFKRTKDKIWHKADQASVDHPTIIIIRQEDGSYRYASPEIWIQELEDTIFRCEDVIAVVLTIHEFGNLERVVQPFGKNYFVQRTERYALGSQSLIVMNKNYKKENLPEQKWRRLFEHFL